MGEEHVCVSLLPWLWRPLDMDHLHVLLNPNIGLGQKGVTRGYRKFTLLLYSLL